VLLLSLRVGKLYLVPALIFGANELSISSNLSPLALFSGAFGDCRGFRIATSHFTAYCLLVLCMCVMLKYERTLCGCRGRISRSQGVLFVLVTYLSAEVS
jgi:hypothetical protein